jgi:hypothetical protein
LNDAIVPLTYDGRTLGSPGGPSSLPLQAASRNAAAKGAVSFSMDFSLAVECPCLLS